MAHNPYALRFVPDHLKAQEMCDTAVSINPTTFFLTLYGFKTQEMCIKGVEVDPWLLDGVPNRCKSQEMCNDAVVHSPYALRFVLDWFVTQQQIELWDDGNDFYDDDEIIEWYGGHQKCKAQKAQIKKELMLIFWHSSHWWDWCISKDKKKQTEKLWR